jgi:hypothetical protein
LPTSKKNGQGDILSISLKLTPSPRTLLHQAVSKDHKVKAKSLVCFWAAREIGMSFSELARSFSMRFPGIGYPVEKGKTLRR